MPKFSIHIELSSFLYICSTKLILPCSDNPICLICTFFKSLPIPPAYAYGEFKDCTRSNSLWEGHRVCADHRCLRCQCRLTVRFIDVNGCTFGLSPTLATDCLSSTTVLATAGFVYFRQMESVQPIYDSPSWASTPASIWSFVGQNTEVFHKYLQPRYPSQTWAESTIQKAWDKLIMALFLSMPTLCRSISNRQIHSQAPRYLMPVHHIPNGLNLSDFSLFKGHNLKPIWIFDPHKCVLYLGNHLEKGLTPSSKVYNASDTKHSFVAGSDMEVLQSG